MGEIQESSRPPGDPLCVWYSCAITAKPAEGGNDEIFAKEIVEKLTLYVGLFLNARYDPARPETDPDSRHKRH